MKSIISLLVILVSLSVLGKDLEIANIQLCQYLGTDGSRPPKDSTQSISIANRSGKTIDLYGYSVTNNGKVILRIDEHVELEKDAKKVFPLLPDNKGILLPIDLCFLESMILSQDEKEYQKEREKIETMMKRYLPYVTETDKRIFNELITQKHPFYFSEIALISPQNEIVDQILVTGVDIQKNPYSLVAIQNNRILSNFTSVFRKGDYIIVCSVPEMAPFQLGSITYSKSRKAITVQTSGNKYFSLNEGFYVPDLKMTLRLYRDKDFKEEIIHLEGRYFLFEIMSEAQADSVEKIGGESRPVEVYYKFFVTHPDFPELSFAEPVTGNALFRQVGRSKRSTSTKQNVESATDGKK